MAASTIDSGPCPWTLVLGTMIENNFQLTIQLYDGFSWMYQRPIVICIEIAIVATIFLAARGTTRPKSSRVKKEENGESSQSLMSLALASVLLFVLVWATIVATDFDDVATGQFPMAVLMLAIPLTLLVLAQDTRACIRDIEKSGGLAPAIAVARQRWDIAASARFFAYLLAIIAVTYVVGQLVALPLFVAIYARRWGKFSWFVSLAYAATCFVIIWGLYGEIMNLHLYPSLLFG